MKKLFDFYNDPEYFRQLFKIAAPIALQNLVMSSLNLISVALIGQLGEASIAAVGLAGQIFFLLNLMLFGIMSGAAMFTAQLWGKRDIANVRRVLGLAIKLGLLASAFFGALSIFIPETVLGLYTVDAEVIAIGSDYLRIFGWAYPAFSVAFAYAMVLRTTGNVRLPLVVSVSALVLYILLAYTLIFGLAGLPQMGVNGAALAGLISRLVEAAAMLFFVYRDKTAPTAATWHDIWEFDPAFIASVMKPVLPVVANEALWSLGITTYNAIYARVGTEAIAAINIVNTIDQIAFVALIGMGNATAILVGNRIGENKPEQAFEYAGRSLGLQVGAAVILGVLMAFFGGLVFNLYNVSTEVIDNARSLLLVMSAVLWIRATNHAIIIGILRAGGDTRFSLILDGLVIWFVGVPLAAAGAFIFGVPVHWVYALAVSEEIVKMIFGLWRFFSRRWINDLSQVVAK
jgi:putative MATE family efflux protein